MWRALLLGAFIRRSGSLRLHLDLVHSRERSRFKDLEFMSCTDLLGGPTEIGLVDPHPMQDNGHFTSMLWVRRF